MRAAAGFAPVIRPRLLHRLDEAILEHRLTTIVAGPGTGKTTLLAQWAATHRTVWHTAVAGDSDAALMHSLIDGLGDHADSPNPELSMAADASTSLSPDENPARADAIAAALAHDVVGRIGGDHVALIIDDAHTLGTDGPGRPADRCHRSPRPGDPARRAVLRGSLPLPTGRLLVDGLATEIAGSELSFTAGEAGGLLDDDIASDSETVDTLLDQTGGWAVAIAFAARRATQHVRSDDESARRGDRHLFAYFAEEVLAAETAETRAALAVAATLPWLTAELAAHLGLGEAGARLTDIERTSIMMTPVADVPGAVAVTPLVRQLLGSDPVAAPLPAVDAAAAAWYESRGAYTAALKCLTSGTTVGAVASFLRTNGQAMLAGGQGADVLVALEAIRSSTEIDVDLGILWAESLQAVGRPDEAVDASPRSSLGSDRSPRQWRGAWGPCTICAAIRTRRTPCSSEHRSAPDGRRTTPVVWPGRRRSGREDPAMPPSIMRSEPSTWRHGRATTRPWPRRTRC